jgi:hypothetical protein
LLEIYKIDVLNNFWSGEAGSKRRKRSQIARRHYNLI